MSKVGYPMSKTSRLFFGTPCMCSHQKVQSHGGNLGGVLVAVLLRDPRGNHVGVIDSVHLHN